VCPESGEVEEFVEVGGDPLYPRNIALAERDMSDAWMYGVSRKNRMSYHEDGSHQASV